MTSDNQPRMPEVAPIRSGKPLHCSAIRPGEQRSEAVVRTVATATAVDPTELDPLYESIDPDALDALFYPDSPGRARADNVVQFDYSGFTVVVKETGIVELR
ncbi:HalOD1 output domain-containing protein [Haladaptatus sp. NG-SE-30]